ncbi:MAG: hypothetical protein II942_03935 [Alphaproteobacteria bacterium]|nr:hypothetical protein [Alphaproteobacteria bacterium]
MKKLCLLICIVGIVGGVAYAYASACDRHSYYNQKTKQCLSCPENATCNGKTFGCKKGYEKRGNTCELRTAETCFFDPKAKEWGRKCLYTSGSVQSNLCFVQVKPDQSTKSAKCTISPDKHSVIAKNGRCKATYYVGKVCK